MLSYQHAFHAGNLADVHKHALLAWALDYLCQKDKPFSYLETHAGRGLYDLGGPEALKTGEALAGVRRLAGQFPKGHPYGQRLAEVRARYGEAAYPGSPMIAALSMRPGDRMVLAELHKAECAALREVMAPWPAVIEGIDGFAMALARTPPMPRRGLMLIDPPYEVKSDYALVPDRIAAIHRKWNVGVLMLWYPILASGAHRSMIADLRTAVPDIMVHEVRFPPARDGHGMTGSGMAIVNPPFGLEQEARWLAALFKGLLP